MARYTEAHKRATRARILAAAGTLFRRYGYDGVGIDAVMAAAELTRGGFYGHFKSKAALYRAVLAGEHDFINRLKARPARHQPELQRQAIEIASDYLAPAHRQQVLQGCSLAALAADTLRADNTARQAYAQAVKALAAEFSRGLNDDSEADAKALQAVAICIGGLLVAGACDDDAALSEQISSAAQSLVASVLAGEQAPKQ